MVLAMIYPEFERIGPSGQFQGTWQTRRTQNHRSDMIRGILRGVDLPSLAGDLMPHHLTRHGGHQGRRVAD